MKTFRFAIILSLLAAVGFGGWLEAGQYDLKEMTPAVSQAIKGRQDRYAELQSLKAKNSVGENNRGYVVAFVGGRVGSLVTEENRDREVIYQAIAHQNQLGPSGLKMIETVFAEVQRDKAGPGESIQLPSGDWSKK